LIAVVDIAVVAAHHWIALRLAYQKTRQSWDPRPPNQAGRYDENVICVLARLKHHEPAWAQRAS